MPWCDHCDAYQAPNALNPDGTCRVCSNKVDMADMKVKPVERAPWHFWMMVVALVAYLGWRLIEGVVWLAAHV